MIHKYKVPYVLALVICLPGLVSCQSNTPISDLDASLQTHLKTKAGGSDWGALVWRVVNKKMTEGGVDLESIDYDSVYIIGSSIVDAGYYEKNNGFEYEPTTASEVTSSTFIVLLVSDKNLEIIANIDASRFLIDFYSDWPRDYSRKEYPGVLKYSINLSSGHPLSGWMVGALGRFPDLTQREMVAGGQSFGGARLSFVFSRQKSENHISWIVNPGEDVGVEGRKDSDLFLVCSLINQILEAAMYGKERKEIREENRELFRE